LVPILKSHDPTQALRDASIAGGETGSVARIGHMLFNQYLIPFEVTSVLILVAIIGVVVLAKRQPEKK
jgi:NADH-quinone oxidoreductase subunit J